MSERVLVCLLHLYVEIALRILMKYSMGVVYTLAKHFFLF